MKEIKNINELFDSVGKKMPFAVPNGYFDTLPTRIQDKCVGTTAKRESQITPLFQVIKTQLALATGFIALALLAFAGYFYLQPTQHINELTHDDYIEIVQKKIYEYDEGRISMETKGYLNYDSLKNELREEMIKYLLDENIDYVTLMEQQ